MLNWAFLSLVRWFFGDVSHDAKSQCRVLGIWQRSAERLSRPRKHHPVGLGQPTQKKWLEVYTTSTSPQNGWTDGHTTNNIWNCRTLGSSEAVHGLRMRIFLPICRDRKVNHQELMLFPSMMNMSESGGKHVLLSLAPTGDLSVDWRAPTFFWRKKKGSADIFRMPI